MDCCCTWQVCAVLLLLLGLWWLFGPRRNSRVDGLDKKAVFISGCDTGFGRAMALRLDGMGVLVYAGCLTEQGRSSLRKDGSSRLQALSLDVTDDDSVSAAYRTVCEHLPEGAGLWGVINNAGVLGQMGPCEMISIQQNMQTFQVNYFGALRVTMTLLPLLKRSRGRVIFVSSLVNHIPLPSLCPYSVSKIAIRAYADILRAEKKQWGIKVVTLLPGGFRTNIADNMVASFRDQYDSLPQHLKDEYGEEYFRSRKVMGSKSLGYNNDITSVLDAYEDGLFSTNPKIYYRPGNDSKISYLLSLILPVAIVDKLTAKVATRNKPQILKDREGR